MQDNNTQGYIEELSRHILYVHRILKVLSYATDTMHTTVQRTKANNDECRE
jgi:hypothetical protein